MKFCLTCEHPFTSAGWQCPVCGKAPQQMHGYPAFAPELARGHDGYDAERYVEMPDIEDENFWRKARNRLFTWAMGRYFPDASNFLEIGSGIGVVLRAFGNAFPGLTLWGTEAYLAGLDRIREKLPQTKLFQADARHIPFREAFDVIAAFDVIEHIPEDVKVLKEMYKATRPGGGILISVPQHPFLWSQRDEYLCHKRRYTKDELVKKVKTAGFKPLRVTSFITFPFPVMAFSALRNRKPRKNFDPFAEFRISPMTNQILDIALLWERQVIKAGISFPFGGSLFVVARK